jgi:hypothetical protein
MEGGARMSGDVVTRNREGVWLRYSPDKVGRHHVERRPQPSDCERIALLKAERACLTIRIIGEHVLGDLGMRRLLDELRAIQRALDLKRPALGMFVAKSETA